MDTNALAEHHPYDLAAIERADLSPKTKAQYQKALRNYTGAGGRIGDIRFLQEYAAGLPKSSRAFLKAAVRLVTVGYERDLKSGVTAESLPEVQAALYRLDAINSAVTVPASRGEKAHTWLSLGEVQAVMAACSNLRDWIVMALLVGAGLRREELANLRFTDILKQPKKNGWAVRTVLQVRGKGAKDRVIPISDLLAARLEEWRALVGGELVARSIDRKGRPAGDSLSEIGIFKLVRKYGAAIGRPGLDPHDLRRTYAQLGYDAGVPLTQISKLLGHESLETTRRYLNLDINLESTISDFIPLG